MRTAFNRSTRKRAVRFFLFYAIPVLFLSATPCCQSHGPSNYFSAQQFTSWYGDPASQRFDSCRALCVSQGQFDSVAARAARINAGSPGMYATVLTDSFGADYTVGYATPAAFRADTAYPLILYLHGGTGSSLTTKGEKAYDMLMPLADSFSLFLASPSASRSAPWWSPAGMSRVLQTLRFMTLRYPVDPGKVILAGVSDGAAGCYGAANTISSPFAGFIAVSGFGGMLPHFGMRLFPGNIMQRPVYNVNAGKDRIYDINEVNRFLDWLNENGARVERKEYADEMHGFDYRKKEFGAFANYIRTWSKPVARGINWTLVRGFPCCADNLLDCTPDAASDAPHVDAFWKNDTLQMNSKGVREVVVSFPGVTKPFIVVRINKGKTKKIKALPFDPLLALRLMLHNCSPKPQPAAVYRIRID